MSNLIHKFAKLPFFVYLKLHEHVSRQGLKYLLFKRRSKVLAVVFSAFDSKNEKRSYNYVRSLGIINVDILFLSDIWGYRGSYYLLDNGDSTPEIETYNLIHQVFRGV